MKKLRRESGFLGFYEYLCHAIADFRLSSIAALRWADNPAGQRYGPLLGCSRGLFRMFNESAAVFKVIYRYETYIYMAEADMATASMYFVATHSGARRQRYGKQLQLDDYTQWR